MPSSTAIKQQAQGLAVLEEELEQWNSGLGKAESFALLVKLSLNHNLLSIADYLDEFGASRGIVTSWAEGSLPHPLTQGEVVDLIRQRLRCSTSPRRTRAAALVAR
jgi:hypothetical protein